MSEQTYTHTLEKTLTTYMESSENVGKILKRKI